MMPYMICMLAGEPADRPQQPIVPGGSFLGVARFINASSVKVASRSQQKR